MRRGEYVPGPGPNGPKPSTWSIGAVAAAGVRKKIKLMMWRRVWRGWVRRYDFTAADMVEGGRGEVVRGLGCVVVGVVGEVWMSGRFGRGGRGRGVELGNADGGSNG